jgi:hypothetical protein
LSYTFLEFAEAALAKAAAPLTYQDLWHLGEELGLSGKVKTKGKTPWQTLGAQLYVDVRDNPHTKFRKIGKRPARFFLVSRMSEVTEEAVAKIDDTPQKEPKPKFNERDLHPVLAYFAYADPSFNRGRQIITKTIFHETSKKSGYSDWTHPDMVGFSVPLDDWHSDVLALNEQTDRNAVVLFSFELKKSITKSTYRESFFQAVSNSSWAHHGYLVTAHLADDDDLMAELDRLASSFGIGIIHLNLDDMSESRTVYPARARSQLDWETINKLCEQNKDFQRFLENVRIDVGGRKLHREEYDAIKPDIDQYIQSLGM